MSDPSSMRQEPSDHLLIAGGNALDALTFVDAIDCGLQTMTAREAINALRFWIGEAEHFKRLAESLEGSWRGDSH